MMNKTKKGFSLAELMISLLIISIVLAAAIPTVTRRSATSEQIWRWSSSNNSAYFGVGSNQSAIIGADSIPFIDDENKALSEIIYDSEVNVGDLNYSNYGDKLVILKKSTSDNAKSHFVNSLISFYTLVNSTDATTNDIHYAGRIASDTHNLAFGIGSLQRLDEISDSFSGYNTALGHYTLMRNTGGQYNTALGEKALSYNEDGANNTAVGYKSLFYTGNSDENAEVTASNNTAIGSEAMTYNISGSQNTAIGAQSNWKNATGSNNTVIGNYAFSTASSGSGNTAIGTNACNALDNSSYNICIGMNSGIEYTEANYGLFIGSSATAGYDESGTALTTNENNTPLISGYTQKHTDTYGTVDKSLTVSARYFNVAPPYAPHDSLNVLKVEALQGADGYSTGDVPAYGTFHLNTYNDSNSTVGLTISGEKTGDDYQDIVYITTDSVTSNYSYSDLDFNDSTLKIGFNDKTDNDKDTLSIYTGNSNIQYLKLNGNLTMNTDSNAYINFNENSLYVAITESNITPVNMTMGKDNNNNGYFSVNTVNGSGEGYFIVNSTNFYTDSSTTKIASDYVTIGSDDTNVVNINNGDITLYAITQQAAQNASSKVNQSVAGNIVSLWDAVYALQTYTWGNQGGGFSDERLKNISGDNTAGLKEINELEVKNFTFKDDKEKTPHVGVIAQQLQKIFPNSVKENKDGYLTIRTEEIFYAMVNAIKELCTQIQDLTAKITGLDKRISELEKQNQMLEKQNKEFEKRLEKLEKQQKK